MLLSLVLSSSLMAQAGQFPVVHGSGLGLARGASTDGAQGLGGTRSTEAFTCEIPSAGRTDHFNASHSLQRVHSRLIPARVCIEARSHGVSHLETLSRQHRSTHSNSSQESKFGEQETAKLADCGAGRSLAVDDLLHLEIEQPKRGFDSCDGSGIRIPGMLPRARHAFFAFLEAALQRLLVGVELPSVEGVLSFLVHGLDLFGLDGVDVFHEQRIEQALADVNNYLCGIFAGAA